MKRSARLMALGSMGLEFATLVIAGLLIGLQVDKWLGWSPIGIIVGILAGMTAAIVRMLAYLKFLNANSTEDEQP